jgi:hypothetical protein
MTSSGLCMPTTRLCAGFLCLGYNTADTNKLRQLAMFVLNNVMKSFGLYNYVQRSLVETIIFFKRMTELSYGSPAATE